MKSLIMCFSKYKNIYYKISKNTDLNINNNKENNKCKTKITNIKSNLCKNEYINQENNNI